MRRLIRRYVPMLTVLAAFAALAASFTASASAATTCPSRTTKTAFSTWGDTHQYFLVPNGGFENGTANWTKGGSPTVVSGNETYYLNSTSDKSSAKLPPGSSFKTGQICTNPNDQTVRLMVKGATGQLKFDATILCGSNIRTWSGQVDGNGSTSWRPSPVIQFALDGQCTTTASIQVAFTALGSTWQIDDVYVDPFKDK